jgi:hypothetical protein
VRSGRAADIEPDGRPAPGLHVSHGDPLGDVERVVEVPAGHRDAYPDLPRSAGQVRPEEQGVGNRLWWGCVWYPRGSAS